MKSPHVAVLAGFLGACAWPAGPTVSTDEQAIINGTVNPGDPAVVMLSSSDGLCTGTLVSPRVVLTAAHCIKGSIDAGRVGAGRVSFGPAQGEFVATIATADMYAQRYYEGGLNAGFDIGLVLLAEPAPDGIEPMVMNAEPLDDTLTDVVVRAIGYGVSDGQAQTGAGTKREVELVVNSVTDEHVLVGSDLGNTCQGDSGGPLLLERDGQEVIIGVTAFGESGCEGISHKTRVDRYLDSFIREVIAAWDGPCARDFSCQTEGCEFLDPDCDVCAFDGVCGSGCERLDLDCPVAGFAGELCADDDGCESRMCEPAPDDDRIQYCTTPCETDDDCEQPLRACDDDGRCRFVGPTASAQGYPCEADGECRSGNCDLVNGICVEPCGAGGACGDGYECASVDGVDSCTIPGDGVCGCTVGGRPVPRPIVAGLLLLTGILVLRRRGRRGERR